MLPDAEEQFITQELKNLKNVSLNREMLFDRRFTETVAPLPVSANGARWSTRIRTITCHLHAKLFKGFALVISSNIQVGGFYHWECALWGTKHWSKFFIHRVIDY